MFSLPLFLNFSCDGVVTFKGNVLENNLPSVVLSDSIYSSFSLTNPIQKAMVNFYVLDDNDSSLGNMFSNTFFTDSLGYFKVISGVGYGTYNGLLVVSKKGFVTDSIHFEFESSEQPICFIVNLKR